MAAPRSNRIWRTIRRQFFRGVRRRQGRERHGAWRACGARRRHRSDAGHHQGRATRIPSCWAEPGVTVLESAHPIPDGRSLAAGEELVRRLAGAAARSRAAVPDFRRQLQPGGIAARRGRDSRSCCALNERGLASGWDIARAQCAARAPVAAQGRRRGTHARRAPRAGAVHLGRAAATIVDVIGSGLLGRDRRADAMPSNGM